MLKEALDNFSAYQSQDGARGRRWTLVFHTSCVYYLEEDLQAAAALRNFDWVVPDNVRWELLLLCKYSRFSRFRSNAKLILDKAQRSGTAVCWDLEDLYQPAASSGRSRPQRMPGDICRDGMIFAFGNPLKEEEFLRRTPAWQGDYYIVFTKANWRMDRDASVQRIADVKNTVLCQTKAITAAEQEFRLDMDTVYLLWKDRVENIRVSDLRLCGDMVGNYSHIYLVPGRTDLLLKIYRRGPLDDVFQEKLRCLKKYGEVWESMPILFPIALLTTANGTVIGYAMRRAYGITLRELMHSGWREYRADGRVVDHNVDTIFFRLTLLLIELHCSGFIVNDLSYNNVIVGADDQVYLVDCDSFQLGTYPGGMMTRYYRHPGIQGNPYARLREPIHEYFAYAVLLQQCYMGLDNPLGRTEDCSDPSWGDIPFDPNRNYSADTLASWNAPGAFRYREGMLSEFTFQKNLSFGAWLRILELFCP